MSTHCTYCVLCTVYCVLCSVFCVLCTAGDRVAGEGGDGH